MINIITTSQSCRNRGPKKVVENLIRGLDIIGYPYVINAALGATRRLWIHDDVSALPFIASLPPEIKVIIGPNLFVNPENIPAHLDLSRALYIHPSPNVIDIWTRRGYRRSPLAVYPTGIDTDMFSPSSAGKKNVLLYFKNRSADELKEVEVILKKKNIPYRLMKYGSYRENEYIEALGEAKYMIWLGGYESQGIALEEGLASGLPVLVIDKKALESGYDSNSTAVPYFDGRCGLRIQSIEAFEDALSTMDATCSTYTPRSFVLDHLGLEKQAHAFIALYEKQWGLTEEEGKKETLQSEKKWQRPFPYQLKGIIIRAWRKIRKSTIYRWREKLTLAHFKKRTTHFPVIIIDNHDKDTHTPD